MAVATSTYQVAPPEQFNFRQPEEWPRWARCFKRFRKVSGLEKQSEERQVNTLLYSMGDEADEILRSFRLSAEDAKKYDTVKSKFDQHFVQRRNIIYERAKFNLRKQEPGESVDTFITALYGLAEHCAFAALHDELIRDCIVVGLRDSGLSEKLQLDPELTLQKAVTQARQAEAVKQQQALLRGAGGASLPQPDTNMGAVHRRRGTSQSTQSKTTTTTDSSTQPKATCGWCGRSAHAKQRCPATCATNAANVATSSQCAERLMCESCMNKRTKTHHQRSLMPSWGGWEQGAHHRPGP